MWHRQIGVGIVFLALAGAAGAEEWPGWRGPRGDGTSEETIPIRWGKNENIRWKVPVPGTGHSSPVVWGDRVFLTTCMEKDGRRLLLCLDRRDGRLLWQRTVLSSRLEQKHHLNSYASSTPATDGRSVFVSFFDFPNMEIACYDFDGKLVWRRSPGKFYSRHGYCSSPVLYKDLVILNGDQDAEAYLVALDKATGQERWRADRPNRTRSYCVPIIVDAAGKKQLVLSGSKCVASYDPDTGKQIWIIDGPTEQYVASLVFLDGLLFMTAGFPEYHNMAIRPDGVGNVTQTHVLWHEKKVPARKASYVPSPIAADKYFFLVSDEGFASCFDARTGRRQWMERLGRHHSASPVSAGGNLYFLADEGTTYVVKASGKFELVCQNELGEECRASPAVAHGQVFIRTLNHLYCIGSADRGRGTN
jgi:outer membrane protein assembly factor BamB